MTLVEKIKQIYPALTDEDFVNYIIIQNDSNEKGDYISNWNYSSLSKPTDEQLANMK